MAVEGRIVEMGHLGSSRFERAHRPSQRTYGSKPWQRLTWTLVAGARLKKYGGIGFGVARTHCIDRTVDATTWKMILRRHQI